MMSLSAVQQPASASQPLVHSIGGGNSTLTLVKKKTNIKALYWTKMSSCLGRFLVQLICIGFKTLCC